MPSKPLSFDTGKFYLIYEIMDNSSIDLKIGLWEDRIRNFEQKKKKWKQ